MLRLWKQEDGAALVEMALILPFLTVLIFGAFEVGNLLYQYQLIESGVRDGARYLARVSNPAISTKVCDPLVIGSATYTTNAKQIAIYGAIGGATQRVSWWGTADITITYSTIANAPDPVSGLSPYRGPNPIQIVQLSTTPSYAGFGMLSYIGFPSPLTFNIAHQERCIGSG